MKKKGKIRKKHRKNMRNEDERSLSEHPVRKRIEKEQIMMTPLTF
jgi:hypothetical protein